MRFVRLRASAYGQLDDVELKALPADRAAVLLGNNEAGKSTWFHALNTVLYGFSPARPDRFPYRSWTVDRFPEIEAELVTSGGRKLRVHRRLANQPQGVLEQSGQTIPLRNRPLDEVAHVGRSLYTTLYALRLEDLAPLDGSQAEKLRDRLLGQAEWTSLRAPRQVVNELEQEAARLWRPDRRGKPRYRALQERLQWLGEERRRAAAQEDEQRRCARLADEARATLQHVDHELALVRARLQRAEEWLPLQRRLSVHADGLCDGPWTQLAAQRLREIPPEVLRGAISQCESARSRWQEAEARLRHYRLQELADEPVPGALGTGFIAGFGVLLAALGAFKSWPAVVILGVIVAVGAGWLGIQRAATAKRLQQLGREQLRQRQEMAAELDAAQSDWTHARSELVGLLQGIPIAPDVLDQADMGLYYQLHRLRAWAVEAAELESELARQEVAVSVSPDSRAASAAADLVPTVNVEDDEGSIEAVGVLRLELERLDEKRSELQREIGRLEQQLQQGRIGPSLGELDGEIASVQDEMRAVSRQRDSLVVQAALLREAERRFVEEHQPDVLKRASGYLGDITGGKYIRLLGEAAGDSGTYPGGSTTMSTWGFEELAIAAQGDAQAISLRAALSRGTLDQAYLALRLAVVDHLDAGEEPLPFLIDEALVHWDQDRLQNGLRLLGRLAATRQIILFTCHPWLAEAAAREMQAQIVDL